MHGQSQLCPTPGTRQRPPLRAQRLPPPSGYPTASRRARSPKSTVRAAEAKRNTRNASTQRPNA
eukprot:8526367-Lingulodinium_polyedra.AAC.1